MEEKELKTSLRQRIAIIAIAVLMLGSVIAGYAAIVANSNGAASGESAISAAKKTEYEEEYAAKLAEFKEVTAGDFEKFAKYTSEMTAYNETSANEGGVKTKDLATGDGRELTADDTDYLAYYAGWCADETVFDSSLDDTMNPTAFNKAIDASLGMIEGWNQGVVGMKLGGVREITIPGELAYGENMEICGGYNKPLKFLVMAVAKEEPIKTLTSELDTAYLKVQYANYGIDYEAL